jgi:hypothetical protein
MRTAMHACCGKALASPRTAIAGVYLADRALTEALLVTEVDVAVDKVFAKAGQSSAGALCGHQPGQSPGTSRLTIGLPCLQGRQLRYHPGREASAVTSAEP